MFSVLVNFLSIYSNRLLEIVNNTSELFYFYVFHETFFIGDFFVLFLLNRSVLNIMIEV